MKTSKLWNIYINMNVILIIDDVPYPRSREGIFVDHDSTHVFLQTEYKDYPVPFSKESIKRIDIKKGNKENEKSTR